MFSRRLPTDVTVNALSERLASLRAAGTRYVDLTESNPTRAGFDYPANLLAPLANDQGLTYEPHPLGMPGAREAVARECDRRGAAVDASQVVLSASSSESYAWLFKLLCNPGDQVLVPRPSYPLFEHLTRLEGVEAAAYDLEYDGRWTIDFDTLERAITPHCRAVLVVSPNNPTGSWVSRSERNRLERVCRERQLALIADEVFVDYPLDACADRITDLASDADVLTFTLGGLSKSAALPQLKLGWIIVGGPVAARERALELLELIADTYLSVSSPVQIAAADLLTRGAAVRAQIQERVRANLESLKAEAARHPACQLLTTEGGWNAVVRVPALRTEERLVLGLLEDERILVHPGYFFDFAHEAFVILSLLPSPGVFQTAAARVLRYTTV